MKLLLIDKAKQIIDIDYVEVVNDKHVRLFPSEHFSADKWHTGYILPDNSAIARWKRQGMNSYKQLKSSLTESQQELLKDVVIHQRTYYRNKIVELEQIIKYLRYDVNEAYEDGFKAGMFEERPRP